ncbi:MAG TPA: NUDIX domain-containing protein [Candidatus Saccharimonadales bacterium]|nr:NUDIX domain-containing protein [Candidatus Saccharimonadales bacterium]
MLERIQIVDENDQPIGASTRQEAWASGSYYRLVQIILRDKKGNFLLQKRSPKKALYPNRWTNAASGHVDEGETYETSAPRELQEEVGISAPLEFLGKILIQRKEDGKTFNQFNGVFMGTIPHDTQFNLQADEVSEVRWFTPAELKERIAAAPDDFTPAMVRAVEEFYA